MDKVSRSGIEILVRAHRRFDEARIITRVHAARNLPVRSCAAPVGAMDAPVRCG
jgi:hypothetical protein